MIKIHKTNPQTKLLDDIETYEPNCWIDLISPTHEEISEVIAATGVEADLLTKMLDENELPRIESSDGATLVVVDTPFIDDDHEYITYPLGIISVDRGFLITISPRRSTVLNKFRKNQVGNFRTAKKTRFIIQVLNHTAAEYLKVLNEVYRDIDAKEELLKKGARNKDLIDLLATKKTLVYFTTSLKENKVVLDRLGKGTIIEFFEGDYDMLEDATIEINQALDMASIYNSIISSVSNTYSSITNNNLNDAMKFLAGATIVLSIPTMISSFLGMNVPFGAFGEDPIAVWLVLGASIVFSLLSAVWLRRRGLL